ncbi:MAG: repair protein [Herbinix sp.]|nr:repair protein [Herbinix sp.]
MRINQYTVLLDENKLPFLVKERGLNYTDEVKGVGSLVRLCNTIFNASKQAEEHVYLVCCTTSGKVCGLFDVSHGTVNNCLMGPREILQRALLCGAAKISIAHNHPGGSIKPSAEDIRATRRIKEAAEMIGLQLDDHIIIGDNDTYYSFAQENSLKEK